jgi:protein-arginine kinase activator protein McsA
MEKPKEERTGALTRKQIQQIKAELRQFIANEDYEGFKSALNVAS